MKFLLSYLLVGVAPPAAARVGVERVLQKQTTGDNCGSITFNGNGFPSGQTLFKFNVLGRDDNWGGTFEPQGDRQIAVPLDGRTEILLLNGDSDQDNGYDPRCEDCRNGDFCILDADATDGTGEICVADPFAGDEPCTPDTPDGADPCTEAAVYAIFARTVGQGQASAGLCVDIDGDESCYVGSTAINPRRATDISQQLLTVCIGDVQIGLFDAICKDSYDNLGPCKGQFTTETEETYYWEYDNQGNRRAEFRFYDAAVLNAITDTTCFGVTRSGATCQS